MKDWFFVETTKSVFEFEKLVSVAAEVYVFT